MTPGPTSSPSPVSRTDTGDKSGQRIRWNGSIKRSNAAPMSSVSFPTPAALLRLAGAVLVEQHDEWEAGDRRYFSESSMLELKTMNTQIEPAEEVNILPELVSA